MRIDNTSGPAPALDEETDPVAVGSRGTNARLSCRSALPTPPAAHTTPTNAAASVSGTRRRGTDLWHPWARAQAARSQTVASEAFAARTSRLTAATEPRRATAA